MLGTMQKYIAGSRATTAKVATLYTKHDRIVHHQCESNHHRGPLGIARPAQQPLVKGILRPATRVSNTWSLSQAQTGTTSRASSG